MLAVGIVALFPQGLHAVLHGGHGHIAGGGGRVAVGHGAAHGEGIADGQGAFGGHKGHAAVGSHLYPAGFLPLGQVIADGVVHVVHAPLIEHHHGGVQGQLRHGGQAVDAIRADLLLGVHIGIAGAALVDHLALSADHQAAAGQPRFHEVFKQSVQVLAG